MKIRLKLAGLAALAAALPAFAQIKVNDSLTVTGWGTGSYQYTSPSSGPSSDSLNLDAALLQATLTPSKKTTAVVSLYYRPSAEGGVSPSGSELTLLDAYVTYAASDTINLTVGKFLSYLGYESFYLNQDNMITLANQQFLAPIPGYHEGIKLDYSPDKTDTMGVALVDSEYQKPGYAATEGDANLRHQAGFEAYYTNTAITNLTLWAGAGYETTTKPGYDTGGITEEFGPKGTVLQDAHDVYILDLWGSYVLDKNNDTIALEEIYKDGGYLNKGSNWLAYYQYNFTGKVSSWFCISGEEVSGGASYTKYSVAPTYTYNANLAFRLQYSHTVYSSYVYSKADFFGAEVLVKF
jgi:hypothetical protein